MEGGFEARECIGGFRMSLLFFYEKANRTDFSLIHFLFSRDHVRPARTGAN
jgi:hypothetical protein